MRFADLFASVDLSIFPLVGLLIFLAVFVAVGIRVMRESKRVMTHNANLPLEDGSFTPCASIDDGDNTEASR